MLRTLKLSLLTAAAVLGGGAGSQTNAQGVIVQYPPVPVAPVYYTAAPVVVAAPVYPAPAYYSVAHPAPVVYPAPVVVAPAPVVARYPVVTRTRVRFFPHHIRVTTRAW